MTSAPFRNARIVTSTGATPGKLLVENSIISQVHLDCSTDAPADCIIDAGRYYLSPGSVDIYTHNVGGADFMNGVLDAIYQACHKYTEHDTTSIVPTTITNIKGSLLSLVDLFNQVQLDREGIPNILDLHLEGPYSAYERRGAQDPKHLRSPDPEGYNEMLCRIDRVIRWSFAVELDGADLFLCTLWEHGIISLLAHSNATYPQVFRTYENGISALTHFYPTMSDVRRINVYCAVGAIEASYLLDDLLMEVTTDGKHLPAGLLRLIYKIKGPKRICLVTDSIYAAGIPDGNYILGSRETGMEAIVEDGVTKLSGRLVFAGNAVTTNHLVRTMLRMITAPLHETIKMMTLTPARLLRIDDRKGSTSEGKDTDLLLFDEDVNVEVILVRERVFEES